MTSISKRSEELCLEGKRRSIIEKKLLSILFNGFANLTFRSYENQILMLNELCELNEYTVLSRGEEDDGYTELTDKSRFCFNVLIALDALVERELVGRKILFTNDNCPENGPIDMEGRLDVTPAYYRSWFARALIVEDRKERTFCYPEHELGENEQPFSLEFEYIQYQLTTKGYDVALKFQEHEDNESRNKQQRAISTSAAKASVSSAKTASLALFAASFIAIGSIGHLLLSIYLEYCKH